MKNIIYPILVILIAFVSCEKNIYPKELTLEISMTPDSSGTVFPGDILLNEGTLVELIATPDSNYVFVKWSGDISSEENPFIFTLKENRKITAEFVLKDIDGDGILNENDKCPDTPKGETVNSIGCSSSQLDSDSDGIMDDKDQCPNTPIGETVNSIGCSQAQIDSGDYDIIFDPNN